MSRALRSAQRLQAGMSLWRASGLPRMVEQVR